MTYTIQHDGKTYTVTAPNEMAARRIAAQASGVTR